MTNRNTTKLPHHGMNEKATPLKQAAKQKAVIANKKRLAVTQGVKKDEIR